MNSQKILITGGAGYIGSHTCVELLYEGYDVVVLDSLINSKRSSLDRVEEITGKEISFHKIDLNETTKLIDIIKKENINSFLIKMLII